jgi:hypothetical protein
MASVASACAGTTEGRAADQPAFGERALRWIVTVIAAAGALAAPVGAHASMQTNASVAAMTTSAARVFRGHCASAATETVEIAGARLRVTTYTFRVDEHLKGAKRGTVTFRQVGAPDGGPRDLGRLAGLPAYLPGTEYVLFLLPAGRAGLTSPAGAAEGAAQHVPSSGDRLRPFDP